jgi:hypothetical protein
MRVEREKSQTLIETLIHLLLKEIILHDRTILKTTKIEADIFPCCDGTSILEEIFLISILR